MHYLCCICLPCLPMWMRWICCFILLIIIILAIIVGILAGTFRMPQVEMNGVTSDPNGLPEFQAGTSLLSFSINLGLKIGIDNPNVESFTLSSVKADVYYPNIQEAIGSGQVNNVYVDRFAITNFTFPLKISYRPSLDPNFVMLHDLADKCKQQQDLALTANISPTVKFAGISITLPTIHQNVNFACPIPSGWTLPV